MKIMDWRKLIYWESISNYKNELMVSLTVTTSDDEEIEVEGVSIDV